MDYDFKNQVRPSVIRSKIFRNGYYGSKLAACDTLFFKNRFPDASITLVKTPIILYICKNRFMPVRFYLDRRHNRYGEDPIRVVWSFNGDRYQTTIGASVPPEAWDGHTSRVTQAAYNHKNTASVIINDFIQSIEKAVNCMENFARTQNAFLTKTIVK